MVEYFVTKGNLAVRNGEPFVVIDGKEKAMSKIEFILWTSLHWNGVEKCTRQRVVFILFTFATSERALLRSDFSMQKNQSHTPSFLLFRKRHARLACSLVNALTTAHSRYHLFARCACGANISTVRYCHVGASFISLAPIFYAKKIRFPQNPS